MIHKYLGFARRAVDPSRWRDARSFHPATDRTSAHRGNSTRRARVTLRTMSTATLANEEARRTYEEIRAAERRALATLDEAGSETSANDGGAAVRKARALVLRLREMIEELREIGEDCDNEKEAVDIKRAVAEREVALENTRAIVREAALDAAAKERAREAEDREALLMGKSGTSAMDEIKASGAVSVSSEATAGLRRARQMMATELEKGEKTLAALTESTATMERTGTEYSNQSTKLKVGRRLLTTIEWQTFMDRIILWSGFSIFLLVVIHILWKRTPFLARFHPLYYKWWNKDDGVVETVETIDVSEPIVPSDVDVPPSIQENAALLIEGEEDPYKLVDESRREEL